MQEIDQEIAARVRSVMAEVTASKGGVRAFATLAGISEPTVREIITTGLVKRIATAAKLETATGGRLTTGNCIQPGAKGEIYQREPGSSILALAVSLGKDVSEILGSMGINHHDLWAYMNHRHGDAGDLRKRVRTALEKAGLPVGQETTR